MSCHPHAGYSEGRSWRTSLPGGCHGTYPAAHGYTGTHWLGNGQPEIGQFDIVAKQ